MKKISIFYIFSLFILMAACSRDMTEPPDNSCVSGLSYDVEIKDIINTNCAYSGCHNGGGGAPGDFSSYGGLNTILSTGLFTSRVFDSKDNPNIGMPPDYASQGPTDLTEIELTMLMEWVANGYPESANSDFATYDESIKDIIDNTCAYSGCHDGLSGVGSYLNFEGVKVDIDSDRFFKRVVTRRDDPTSGMPPDYAEDGPKDLSEAEYQLILCWIENGYPEN